MRSIIISVKQRDCLDDGIMLAMLYEPDWLFHSELTSSHA